MAGERPSGDPRLGLPQPLPEDVRPVVAGRPFALSGLTIAIGLALFGVLLFLVLDSRRRALETPAVRLTAAERARAVASEPPPLYVPPGAPAADAVPAIAAAPQTVPFVLPEPPTRQPRMDYVPQQIPPPPMIQQQPMPLPPPPVMERASSPSALVLDRSGTQEGDGPAEGGGAPAAQPPGARATATVLPNRATTVPQGTLIPAVLETGFDSTKPGFARAVVSRDVRSFDGSRILIPRGSRVTGEYAGGAEAGQKRAVINWTRLVRPDGVAIAIGSPATNSVGRNGVRANVNSHFLERLFPAILQSALDIGVNLASRPRDGSVVIGLPGSGSSSLTSGQSPPAPTLSVRPGTSIAIFVTRDLDFTGVGNPR
ncbi:TrbI/VirB10 family protein [Sphingomonas sp. MS122]|uniref:TrbI/VirB10 family protein n=1 Tax=Sphingomonas sp. MS122 TaxID=3412683 RepID=UPI003C2B2CC6